MGLFQDHHSTRGYGGGDIPLAERLTFLLGYHAPGFPPLT
jgi:hypothetical protein